MEYQDNVIAKLHPYPSAYWGNYVAAVAVFFAPLWLPFIVGGDLGETANIVRIASPLIGIFVAVVTEVVRLTERFVISENGVAREFSFLATSRIYVEYEKIEQISTSQTVMDRVLGVGTVHIDTAGEGAPSLVLHDVKDPYEVEALIRRRIAASEAPLAARQ